MKMVYKGDLPEVELLKTGKKFQNNQSIEVTKEEAELLKDHPDFESVKKGGDKK